jgi:hypothetical protein
MSCNSWYVLKTEVQDLDICIIYNVRKLGVVYTHINEGPLRPHLPEHRPSPDLREILLASD